MDSPTALAPDELPSPRSGSVSYTVEDLEKQATSSSVFNRPDTWSHSSCTTFAKELPRRDTLLPNGQPDGVHRRDTGFSTATSSFSPRLERRQTWKVEEEALHGYPQLAAMLGTEDNYAIYRRFAALNARNLLYHQAKLIHLEHQLHDLELMHGHGEHEDLHYKIEHLFSDIPTSNPAAPFERNTKISAEHWTSTIGCSLTRQSFTSYRSQMRPLSIVSGTIFTWRPPRNRAGCSIQKTLPML